MYIYAIILIVFIVVCLLYFFNYFKLYTEDFVQNSSKINSTELIPNGYCDCNANYIEPIILNNIITPKECKYIISYANKRFKKSQLVGDNENKSIRDSETCWIHKKDNEIVGNIIRRVCKQLGKPFENAEDFQVVRYKTNGLYKPHHDACCDNTKECKDFLKRGGQRILTIVIYLTDNFKGGETNFPNLGKRYKPPKYSGVLFHPLDSKQSKCHPYALHEGTTVKNGIKMIANIWIREGVFV
jgi:prolyl 4-hydroxylase